jgi:crossover junction endodeoxyribonuclease RusA
LTISTKLTAAREAGKRNQLREKIASALAEQWPRTAQPRITLDLPFPVTMNRLWMTSSTTGEKIRTPRYNTWLTAVGHEINRQKPGCIDGDYRIRIVLGRPDRRKRDQDNLAKCVNDALVTNRVIDDDSKAVSTTITWSDRISGCRVHLTAARAA